MYVCYRRTYSSAVRVLPTYAFLDVRHSAAYVLWKWRFVSTLLENEIRDYAVEIEDSGLRSRDQDSGLRSRKSRILDYAEHFVSDEEDLLGLVFRP